MPIKYVPFIPEPIEGQAGLRGIRVPVTEPRRSWL